MAAPPLHPPPLAAEETGGGPARATNDPFYANHSLSGALAFRRSTAALAGASERSSSAQAALHANKRMRALPAPSLALKQGTLHAGLNAGGDVARTARERSYELRPQEPHPLRFRDRLEKRPS
jgi:hypothetical protein